MVISKLDCCDDRAEGRFEEICAIMAPFLKTCGFKVRGRAVVMAVALSFLYGLDGRMAL